MQLKNNVSVIQNISAKVSSLLTIGVPNPFDGLIYYPSLYSINKALEFIQYLFINATFELNISFNVSLYANSPIVEISWYKQEKEVIIHFGSNYESNTNLIICIKDNDRCIINPSMQETLNAIRTLIEK